MVELRTLRVTALLGALALTGGLATPSHAELPGVGLCAFSLVDDGTKTCLCGAEPDDSLARGLAGGLSSQGGPHAMVGGGPRTIGGGDLPTSGSAGSVGSFQGGSGSSGAQDGNTPEEQPTTLAAFTPPSQGPQPFVGGRQSPQPPRQLAGNPPPGPKDEVDPVIPPDEIIKGALPPEDPISEVGNENDNQPPRDQVTAVPEPSSLWLLLTLGGLLCGYRMIGGRRQAAG